MMNSQKGIIVSGSQDKTLKIWDLNSGKEIHELRGHSDRVNSCAISSDGTLIVSGSSDNSLKIWSTGGKLLNTLTGHKDVVRTCTFSSDASFIVSGSSDNTLMLWKTKSGNLKIIFHGHVDVVYTCCVSPDNSFVVSGSKDKTLKIWNTTGQIRTTLTDPNGEVYCCSVSNDGAFIASGHSDDTLKIWNIASRSIIRILQGHDYGVWGCCLSSDNSLTITSAGDKTLKIWDTFTGQIKNTLIGHQDVVSACCINNDSNFIVSTSDDKTLKIWATKSGELINTLTGHCGWVTCVSVYTPLQKQNKISKPDFLSRVTSTSELELSFFVPIYGLCNTSLLSFDEIIEQLEQTNRVPRLASYAQAASDFAQRFPNVPPKMTKDGIAAINLYTMEWTVPSDSLYYILNASLRDQKREFTKDFFPYLKLLLYAMDCLPRAKESLIYRGMKGNFSNHFIEGDFLIWWGLTSCTTSLKSVHSFIGDTGPRVIINVEHINGIKIREFSQFTTEQEVLLPPGRYFKVESTIQQQDLTIVHLKEYSSGYIDGPFARPFWQWKAESMWLPFDPKSSDTIELAFQQNTKQITLNIGGQLYNVDVSQFTQTNTSTHSVRKIKRIDPNK